jgi:hypothetical protein
MKYIGTIHNHYQVYLDGNYAIVRFEHNGISIALENFKYHDEYSDETLFYRATLIINGKRVGTCSNSGQGGCADWEISDVALVKSVQTALKDVRDYIIINQPIILPDIFDTLAYILTYFTKKVRRREVIMIINHLNLEAENMRRMLSNA